VIDVRARKYLLLLSALVVTVFLATACAPATRVVYQTVETTPRIVHVTATPTPTPAPTETPTPLATAIPRLAATCTQDGSVQTLRVDTAAGASIRFQVYLPPCYEQQPTAHYPVVYLLPGAGGNSLVWNQNGAAEVANRLIRAGRVPPFILVTPDIFRIEDPCVTLANDFAPQVDGRFRTLSDSRYRAVGGASSGGYVAACMGFQFPGQFGSVGVFGGGIFVEHVERFDNWIAAAPRQPRVLVDLGDQDDMRPFTHVLTQTLTRQDVPYTLVIEPGGHSFEYWAGHLEMYYLWFAEAW
jgi:enterochelin esterase-like enzyme